MGRIKALGAPEFSKIPDRSLRRLRHDFCKEIVLFQAAVFDFQDTRIEARMQPVKR